MTQFEINQKYGNDFTMEVIKRTAKFVTIKSNFGISRVKIKPYNEHYECIHFKCWIITSGEKFDLETARNNFYERAYYS